MNKNLKSWLIVCIWPIISFTVIYLVVYLIKIPIEQVLLYLPILFVILIFYNIICLIIEWKRNRFLFFKIKINEILIITIGFVILTFIIFLHRIHLYFSVSFAILTSFYLSIIKENKKNHHPKRR